MFYTYILESVHPALPNLQFGSLIVGFAIRHYIDPDCKSYDKDSTIQLSNSGEMAKIRSRKNMDEGNH